MPAAIVALAASAGGLSALSAVFAALPPDFPAPLVVVQHLDPHHRSLMAGILTRRTRLRVYQAREGQVLSPGNAYLAPPDRHLLVEPGGTLALTQTRLVNFVRPSADLLFESVAASYGPGAVAVVLSGTGSDGAAGVKAVKKMGGTVLAQDPRNAEYPNMPEAAVATGCVDRVLPLEAIGPALIELAAPGEAT